MANCTFSRLDSINTALSAPKHASRLILDTATNEIMVAWIDSGASGGSPQPESIRFARFDPVTMTPNSEVSISGDFVRDGLVKSVDMVQLTDGRLIVVCCTGTATIAVANTIMASESTDGGATWTQTPMKNILGAVTPNEHVLNLMTDGTDAWLTIIGLSAPYGTGDVGAYKRTAIDTWTYIAKIFDGTGAGAPGQFYNSSSEQAYNCGTMSSATVGFMVAWRSMDGTSDSRRLTCLYTLDGWATATAVTIITCTNGNPVAPLVVMQIGTRYYLCFNDADNGQRIRLAYTDDVGATWTVMAVITAYEAYLDALGYSGPDSGYDSFACLDAMDNIVIGHSTGQTLAQNMHVVFRSQGHPEDAGGYVLAGECLYTTATATINSASDGHGIVIGDTLYRLIGTQTGSAPVYNKLEFLAVADFPVPEIPTEPVVPEATESGANDNSIYLRNNVAEGGGWSAHLLPVAFFMDWDEGDAETGREVPILLVANPSMDPAIQDPALIPALTRINDPGSYTRRVAVNDGDGVKSLADPFQFRVITQKYTITEPFNRNVCRGVLVAWQFDGGDTATVGVWIDDRLNHVIRLYNTFGKVEERFFPLPYFNNVGSTVQFVIEDHSPYFLAVNDVGVKSIPKKVRG